MPKQITQNPSLAATGHDLVEVLKAQPFTTTLAVSAGTGLAHPAIMQLIRKYIADFQEFGLLTFQIAPRKGNRHGGGNVEYAELNEDQATYLITLFRNNDVVRRFKIRLVKAFRAAITEIERLTHQKQDPQWQLIRDETKVGFKWMSDTLKETRESVGKATMPHHFQNEARMINAVLAGKHGKLDRNTLSASDLVLMAELQRLNAVLIGQNMPYKDRKAVLMDRAVKKLAA